MKQISLIINRVLHLFEVRRIKTKEKVIFLTFDDGPEPNITEFILEELRKYKAKATFFCKGKNAEKYSDLLEKIKKDGHMLGNHTYSHISGLNTQTEKYVEDVEKADEIIDSNLFRPPWGSINISTFFKLMRKYKIVYWSLISGDTDLDKFNKEKSLNKLKSKTCSGDIVLFHFCMRHENETKALLPEYLDWLYKNGYHSEAIK